AVLQRVQRHVVDPRLGEVAAVGGVVADGCEVRGDVDGVRGDRDRRGEVDLLPAGSRLVGERRRGQLCPGRRPQVPHVRTRVAGPLVEADAGDLPAHVTLELHAEVDGPG